MQQNGFGKLPPVSALTLGIGMVWGEITILPLSLESHNGEFSDGCRLAAADQPESNMAVQGTERYRCPSC